MIWESRVAQGQGIFDLRPNLFQTGRQVPTVADAEEGRVGRAMLPPPT